MSLLKSLDLRGLRCAIFSIESGKAVGYIEFGTKKHIQAVAKNIKNAIGQCSVQLDPCGRGYVGAAAAYNRVFKLAKETQVQIGSGEFNPRVLRRAEQELKREARQAIAEADAAAAGNYESDHNELEEDDMEEDEANDDDVSDDDAIRQEV